MSRQTLKDNNFRIIGFIETRPDGIQVLKNASFQTQGYYHPSNNLTKDEYFRIIGYGNLLTTLLRNP